MRHTSVILHNLDFSKIKSIAVETKLNKSNIQTANILSEKTIEQIMQSIKDHLNLESNEMTWILVTGVLQRGGSNQKAGNAISFTIEDHTLTSHELQKHIKKFLKTGTNRQLARSINNDIAKIALEFNLPGDLHTQMKMEHPNITDEEAVWCSNFQTTNPHCPDRVREWLVQNYKSRFNR